MPARLPALIFDLDGTLTDSKPGILGCLKKVIEARGMGDCGPLDRFIGPPVENWVADLLPNGSKEDRAAMAREYRECYDREGWCDNSVFPGVREMLAELHIQGFPLYVCTSKQQHFAVRILDAFKYRNSLRPSTETRPNTRAIARLICWQVLFANIRLSPTPPG